MDEEYAYIRPIRKKHKIYNEKVHNCAQRYMQWAVSCRAGQITAIYPDLPHSTTQRPSQIPSGGELHMFAPCQEGHHHRHQ